MFFTPLFVSDDAKELRTKPIISYIDSISEDNMRLNRSATGWHSDTFDEDDLDNMPIELTVAFKIITHNVAIIKKKFGIDKDPVLDNFWFIKNKKYDYNHSHNHAGSSFSGVFYLNVPKHSGDIVFERTDNLLDGITSDITEQNEYNYGSYKITPQENMIVIFPWHLYHRVEQNMSEEGERMIISFNYK